MKKLISLSLVLILVIGSNVFAQTDNKLEVKLADVLAFDSKEYLEGYMKPFVTAFGTGMGGALFHRAYAKGFPRFDVGISAVYLSIPEEAKTYNFGNTEVPTFFGDKSNPPTIGTLNAASGTGLNSFILPQLQINLGLFANFEVMARGFSQSVDEIGDISLLGFGVKYGLSDLIPLPMFPLDLSVQAIYQTFNVSDWISAGTFGMNVQASVSLPALPLDFYAGVGFESTSMTIETDKIPGVNQGIGSVSIDGNNGFRLNIGVGYTLLILNIHADYNLGEYNSFGGGAMIVL